MLILLQMTISSMNFLLSRLVLELGNFGKARGHQMETTFPIVLGCWMCPQEYVLTNKIQEEVMGSASQSCS